jgi:hypothetical protein
MKRNTIKKTLLAAAAGLMSSTPFFTACTDLSPEIYSDVQIDDYYKTSGQFATLIANAYSQLAGEYGYVYREGYWSLQEYTSDEVVVPTRGTDWYDAGVPIKMHTHTWEPDTRDINNGWSFAYGGTAKCNDVLQKIASIKGDDATQYDAVTKAGIAETKVLRAFYHLLAMDVYGNVTIDDGRPIRQYTRKEVAEWIEREILDNINVLDNSVRYGSMTKPVAHTILAKLYLNYKVYAGEQRWQAAADQCDSVINGGYGYALNPDYFTTFKKDNTNNLEIIFPIVFDAVYAKGNMFHLMTLHYVHEQVYGFTTPTWNGPCTLESFYDKYDANDKRREQWFIGPIKDKNGAILKYSNDAVVDADAIIVKTVSTLQDPTAANTFEGARFVKFEIEQGIEHHANSDFPIYRYADILLMKAEALMRLNGGTAAQDAVDLVNQLCPRTGLAQNYTTATLTLDELLDERGRELAWEGHRRQDLIRFGKYADAWEFKEITSPNRSIFPIPQWVLDGNPGVYTQNTYQ